MAETTLVGPSRSSGDMKAFRLTPYATSRLGLARNKSLSTESSTLKKRQKISIIISYSTDNCIYGTILVAQTKKGICAFLIGNNEINLQQDLLKKFPKSQITKVKNERSKIEMKMICKYLENPSKYITEFLTLDLYGSEFQLSVWKALLEIPAGSTETYSQLAYRANLPQSNSRAVANACGQNHVAFLVPCHRIKRSNGQLGGYHWGIDIKKMLQSESKT